MILNVWTVKCLDLSRFRAIQQSQRSDVGWVERSVTHQRDIDLHMVGCTHPTGNWDDVKRINGRVLDEDGAALCEPLPSLGPMIWAEPRRRQRKHLREMARGCHALPHSPVRGLRRCSAPCSDPSPLALAHKPALNSAQRKPR